MVINIFTSWKRTRTNTAKRIKRIRLSIWV